MRQSFPLRQFVTLIAEQLGSSVPETKILQKRLAGIDEIPAVTFQQELRTTLQSADPMFDPRQTLPNDLKAVASAIWRAAAHLTLSDENAQRLAVLFIIERLGYRILIGEPDPKMTFERFQLFIEGQRLTAELKSLKLGSPASEETFTAIRDRLHELQAASYRLDGTGMYNFIADTQSQLEWWRDAITDPQLLEEGIKRRLQRAFAGMRKVDGQYRRTDPEVLNLLTKVKGRMAKRRRYLEDLRVAIRGICGLNQDYPVNIRVHGPDDHFHRLISLTVRGERARRGSHGKSTTIFDE